MATAFRDVVTSVTGLREVIAEPIELIDKLDIGRIDEHCRAFIERSPFVLLGTCGADGRCDVSPKGDAPGFVQVFDEHTLVIPDRLGNRRLDSLRNIVENPHIGLLFIVPGVDETMRVNGAARIVRDADVLERFAVKGKPPALAIAVDVQEAFLHCPKCFRRSKLWDTETWPARAELPSMATIVIDHLNLHDVPMKIVESELEKSNSELY